MCVESYAQGPSTTRFTVASSNTPDKDSYIYIRDTPDKDSYIYIRDAPDKDLYVYIQDTLDKLIRIQMRFF